MVRLLTQGSSAFASMVLATALTMAAPARQSAIPIYSYTVIARYPHDPRAFTQGRIFKNGFLYESTGLHGRSFVRKVRLDTGAVLQKTNFPSTVFGESLTEHDEHLLVLTWTSGFGYVLDFKTFSVKGTFTYPGEGWGLTRSSIIIFMSDGTSQIRLLDPKSLQERSRINVTALGAPVRWLNELEWVNGEIFANVWQTDRIARINPKTGNVVGWIDLSGLLERHGLPTSSVNVLNGIAYDSAKGRLFVTGKLWPNFFQIKLVPTSGAN